MKPFIHRFGLLAAMLSAILTASAYDFEADGIFYNITSMSNLEVSVTYKEFRHDFMHNYYENNSYTGDIVIPATVNYNNRTFTVTSIGSIAFGAKDDSKASACSITSVSLPSTIKSIGEDAFYKCGLITEIELPEDLVTIGSRAFCDTKLTSIIIPDKVETINWSAFADTPLQQVILGKNIKSIGSKAFSSSKMMEVFFTGLTPPEGARNGFGERSELYVPSKDVYGFGIEYISFSTDSFSYDGHSHNIEWQNNLKAYNCRIDESECFTEINAGEYEKYLTAVYSNNIDLAVTIPYHYTISKAPLSLNVHDVQKAYGDPNPQFTCDISGFVNQESEITIGSTPSFSCEANKYSNIGDYRILASFNAPNYEISYRYGTLSVLKAPLEITVKNVTKKYGDDNPQYELLFVGLKNDETIPEWINEPEFITDADRYSQVGTYQISAVGAEARNYNITELKDGILDITKKDLTIKAADCSRPYNTENPEFPLAYIGFVNNDTEDCLVSPVTVSTVATKISNVGDYPITVSGGEADNYYLIYQSGTLTITPLAVGFKQIYNTVTYGNMEYSTLQDRFNYLPEITGPYDPEDFDIQLFAIDTTGAHDSYDEIIEDGEYAGKYVSLGYDNSNRPTWAGKYIYTLVSNGTNPNVIAHPARAYVTVKSGFNELAYNGNNPLTIKEEETVDLDISYKADLWCDFNCSFDNDIILLSGTGVNSNDPKWSVTGLKEGVSELKFSITSKPNEMGFYNFNDSQQLSLKIIVEPASGVESIKNNGPIHEVARYDLYGHKVSDDYHGIVIVCYSDGSTKKVVSTK